jgi:signal transduction histidine kinase
MAEAVHSRLYDRRDLRWFRWSLAVIVLWMLGWIFLPRGDFLLVALSDVSGALLLAAILAGMVRNALRSEANARVFWWLMAIGGLCWVITQASWVYFEVIRRKGVPDLFWGDFILFIHLIPMMVAAAGRPHAKRDLRKSGQQVLDQLLLAFWWIYLYLIVLAPWEFVKVDAKTYSFSYNVLYMIEHVALMIAFGMLYRRAQGAWKVTYWRFFIAALAYGIGSLVVNIALDLPRDIDWAYYSGGPYDMPWIAALLVWNWAVYRGKEDIERLSTEQEETFSTSRVSWSAVFSTAAALTTPVSALYIVLVPGPSPEVDRFRLFTMLQALIVITIIVFIKQWVLNRALVRSLLQSRNAYDDLQRMQTHLLETEKLVSIGRLVAGAAHEINNPLTAIVGYSDLMVTDDSVKPEHRDFAHKILQQARRTKSMVQNLLAFAKQAPLQRTTSDMNAVALAAVQLLLFEHRTRHIETRTDLAPDLPAILVDRGQITQVLLHIMNHATDAVIESESPCALLIRTWHEKGRVLWSCSVTGAVPLAVAEASSPTFRLSASHSIIQDQGGNLEVHDLAEGGAAFVVWLPSRVAGAAEAIRPADAHL